MVDITPKKEVYREATAYGKIKLRKGTIEAIKHGEIKKGDVFSVTRVATIMAVKNTPKILPLCHPIPITGIDIDFDIEEEYIGVKVTVRSRSQTGVEMEALTGVTTALLNIWDMVKYLEKDNTGNYPYTSIVDIKVLRKIKGE